MSDSKISLFYSSTPQYNYSILYYREGTIMNGLRDLLVDAYSAGEGIKIGFSDDLQSSSVPADLSARFQPIDGQGQRSLHKSASPIYVVTDCMDPDGLFSAVILNRALVSSGSHITNLPTRVVDLKERYSSLLDGSFAPGRVIVADLAHNSDINSLESLLRGAVGRGFSFEVYDEHIFQVNESVRRFFSDVVIEDGKASARIVHERFASDDSVSANYAYLAQLADFPPAGFHPMKNLVDNLSDLVLGVRYTDSKMTFDSLVSHYVHDGSLWTPKFQDIVSKYNALKREAKKETEDSALRYGLKRDSDYVLLGVGFAREILYMKPALQTIHDFTNAPVAVVVFEDGKIVFSARHSSNPANSALTSIDCRALGVAYGGGGRTEGGGGNISSVAISKKDFPGVAEGVRDNIVRLFGLEFDY